MPDCSPHSPPSTPFCRWIAHPPATRPADWPRTPGRLIGTGLIRLYQITLSPIVGRSCRHLPTCSEYGYEAIARHGLVSGSWLTFWRVVKCNPLGTSGIDPVPERMRWSIWRMEEKENRK